MDESRRRMILLGVLGLATVACGTYYLTFHRSGSVQVVQSAVLKEPIPRPMAPEENRKPGDRGQGDRVNAGEDDLPAKIRDMGLDEEDEQAKKDRQSGESVKKPTKKIKREW